MHFINLLGVPNSQTNQDIPSIGVLSLTSLLGVAPRLARSPSLLTQEGQEGSPSHQEPQPENQSSQEQQQQTNPPSSSQTHTNNTQPSFPVFPSNFQVLFLQSFPGIPIVVQTSMPGMMPSPNFGEGMGTTTTASNQEQFESLLAELFARAQMNEASSVDKGTSKSTLDSLPKYILVKNGESNLDNLNLSVRQLKNILDMLGVDHSSFIEKTELIGAVQDSSTIYPFSDSSCDYMCTVCADEMQPGELVTKLPCGHWYHYGHSKTSSENSRHDQDCCGGIMKWLKTHNTCPNCKSELPKEMDSNGVGQQQQATNTVEVESIGSEQSHSSEASTTPAQQASDENSPALKRSRSK